MLLYKSRLGIILLTGPIDLEKLGKTFRREREEENKDRVQKTVYETISILGRLGLRTGLCDALRIANGS